VRGTGAARPPGRHPLSRLVRGLSALAALAPFTPG